ncbi:GspH/FimT family pseudopilin [Silanimonas sp.]|jgi:type IV fimbrial biogenesis protein FimT|uniref:GspH/FimT family pseudopilin n=1 Tax=Silanimonas sp. TaxID=1929290 RepID=UPI0037CA9A2F
MQRQSGQSLVELAIVIALLGILGSISAPAYADWARSHKARAFASVLHTELNLARNTAIVRGYRTVLCRTEDGESCRFDGSWSEGFMTFLDVNGNGERSRSEPVLRVTNSGDFKQVRLRISESRPIIVFRPDGRGGGSNLTAVACDAEGRARRTVVISVAGRVRLGQPTAADACP